MLCCLGITAAGGFRLEYFLKFGIWCSIGWDVGGSSSLILGVQRVGNFAMCSLELVLVLVWSLLLQIGGAVITLGLPIFETFGFLVTFSLNLYVL